MYYPPYDPKDPDGPDWSPEGRAKHREWALIEADAAQQRLRRAYMERGMSRKDSFKIVVHTSAEINPELNPGPVEYAHAILEIIGGKQALCAPPPAPRHRRLGRRRKTDYTNFVVVMMNHYMPPWAPPKSLELARAIETGTEPKSRKLAAALAEQRQWEARMNTESVKRATRVYSREESAARMIVNWPVFPQAVAPKRALPAALVTIALAEAGCIEPPYDKAAFLRARKRIEAVFRRWYNSRFLRDQRGAMEELRTWFAEALRRRWDGGA